MPTSTKTRVFRAHVPITTLTVHKAPPRVAIEAAANELYHNPKAKADGLPLIFMMSTAASPVHFRVAVMAHEIDLHEDAIRTPGIVTIKASWSGWRCTVTCDMWGEVTGELVPDPEQ